MTCTAIPGFTPPAHIIEIVALLFGQQRKLRRAGALGLVPIARRAPRLLFRRQSRLWIVNPVCVGFVPRIAEDRVFDRLDRNFLRHGTPLSSAGARASLRSRADQSP